MNPVHIIKQKRNGYPLTRNEIQNFVEGYLNGKVADYQMSAFLMAVYYKGMTDDETFILTEALLNSGKKVDLSHIEKPKVDKHSTGGVGDKTSLILAPLAAAAGLAVPMISGRGLGHTGGTLDKLLSIPGFKIDLSIDSFVTMIEKIGVSMIGQTDELAPADKKIYALRDVTATVDSLPLIISSIISKKAAEGADFFVFDVKIGSGANMQDEEKSRELGKKLISVSRKLGKQAIAVLTDMSQPLGCKIGNWLETEECIEVMDGAVVEDLINVTNVLAGAMLKLGGKCKTIEEGEIISSQMLKEDKVKSKFLELIKEQGGDIEYIKDYKNLKRAGYSKKVFAAEDGYLNELDAFQFGIAAIELKCGRKKVSDDIDPLAGIILNKKRGYSVKKDEIICELFSEKEEYLENAEKYINDGIKVSQKKSYKKPIIIDIFE